MEKQHPQGSGDPPGRRAGAAEICLPVHLLEEQADHNLQIPAPSKALLEPEHLPGWRMGGSAALGSLVCTGRVGMVRGLGWPSPVCGFWWGLSRCHPEPHEEEEKLEEVDVGVPGDSQGHPEGLRGQRVQPGRSRG